jgi:hypothetical protein
LQYFEAQKFALATTKEIVVSSTEHQSIKLSGESAKDVADFYETIYRRVLSIAMETTP